MVELELRPELYREGDGSIGAFATGDRDHDMGVIGRGWGESGGDGVELIGADNHCGGDTTKVVADKGDGTASGGNPVASETSDERVNPRGVEVLRC